MTSTTVRNSVDNLLHIPERNTYTIKLFTYILYKLNKCSLTRSIPHDYYRAVRNNCIRCNKNFNALVFVDAKEIKHTITMLKHKIINVCDNCVNEV